MREIIGYTAVCVGLFIVGYALGRKVYSDEREIDKITINVLEEVNRKLQCDKKAFIKHVPILERKKDYVIALHRKGVHQTEIARRIGSYQSSVSRYLRKWGEIN